METITKEIVHIKEFFVPKISSYIVTDSLKTVFNLRSDSFNSRWNLTTFPAFSKIKDPVNSDYDVILELQCVYSSAPLTLLSSIKIHAAVESRENYESKIEMCNDETVPTWKHTLISHIAMRTCKFSVADRLKFILSFTIPELIFENSVDGSAEIPSDICKMSGKLEFCDVLLVTSCENLVGVNSAIVKCRSRLLETCEEITQEACSKLFSDTNPCKSFLSRIPSRSNIKSNLLTKFEENYAPKSPRSKKSSITAAPYKDSRTPTKKQTQSSLTQFFTTPSPRKRIGHRITPRPDFESPRIQIPCSPRTPKETVKQQSFNVTPSILSEVEVTELEKYGTGQMESPARENHNRDEMKYFKINMSASVAEALIEWIYTGETSRLAELAVPLLIASIRHAIPCLSQACQVQLASSLCVNNLPGILELCWKYGAELLKERALKYATENHKELTASEAWEIAMCTNPKIMVEFTKRLSASIQS